MDDTTNAEGRLDHKALSPETAIWPLPEMYGSQVLLEDISGKWAILAIAALSRSSTRFNQLRRTLRGVTQKTLTQTLRRLERSGMISRTVLDTAPISVEYAITPLGRTPRILFKHKTPLAAAIAAAGLLNSAAARADDGALVKQIVDIFYKIYGSHPGFRVNHAKGVVAEGRFVATAEASGLSRAALFDGSKIPVTVRFSNDGGIPTVPDGAPSNPKGMAIKFRKRPCL
jgi:DNA-binding HxlR family transcriptional regulator